MSENDYKVSLYVVKTAENSFFAGFNREKGEASYVADPRGAKMFTNKFDIKLRPNESVVELVVDLNSAKISESEPFRPSQKTRANRFNRQ
jgi:hypothetical protein